MEERIVNVPVGLRPVLTLGCGDIVHYIDKNLEIRAWHQYEGAPDSKIFSVGSVSEDLLGYLKRCLLENAPKAEEMVQFKWGDGKFFLCVVQCFGR